MTKPVINVTPLIDVLLVLLVIFMIIAPLKPSRFEAKLPQEPKKSLIESGSLLFKVSRIPPAKNYS